MDPKVPDKGEAPPERPERLCDHCWRLMSARCGVSRRDGARRIIAIVGPIVAAILAAPPLHRHSRATPVDTPVIEALLTVGVNQRTNAPRFGAVDRRLFANRVDRLMIDQGRGYT